MPAAAKAYSGPQCLTLSNYCHSLRDPRVLRPCDSESSALANHLRVEPYVFELNLLRTDSAINQALAPILY